MGTNLRKRLHECYLAVRSWPIWGVPPWVRGYLTAVTAAYVAAIVIAAEFTLGSLRTLVLFAGLTLCIAVTVELTRRAGENAGVIKDVFGVWILPIAVLLPPVYVLLAPIAQIALSGHHQPVIGFVDFPTHLGDAADEILPSR